MPNKQRYSINPEIVLSALNRIKEYEENALAISIKLDAIVNQIRSESPEHKVITITELSDGINHNIKKISETLVFLKSYIINGNPDTLKSVKYFDKEKIDG